MVNEITEEHIDRCWAGLAPASVRQLRAADADGGFATIVGLYNTALADRGFSDGGGARRSHRWTRERDDDLDTDIVVMRQLADGAIVEVVADVFDADSVFCIPF